MGLTKDMKDFLGLYGGIIRAAENLNYLKDKTLRAYDHLRDKIFSDLLALEWYYPSIYDDLEKNPIHFRPSELMLKVVNFHLTP